MLTSCWGPTESQWAPHIFSIFKKNWKLNYKPCTDPQGKSLILVKSVVTSSLQTFPLMGTWSRFHLQFKRSFMSYWSHTFCQALKSNQLFGIQSKFWIRKSWFDFKAWQKAVCKHRKCHWEGDRKAPPQAPVQAHFPMSVCMGQAPGPTCVQTATDFLLSWLPLVRTINWSMDDRRNPAPELCQTSDNNI